MKQKYDLRFEEAQDLESKTGLDVYSNDGDIFINENDITRTIGNVLQFGIDYQKAIDDNHLLEVKKKVIDKAMKALCMACYFYDERKTHCCPKYLRFKKLMEDYEDL